MAKKGGNEAAQARADEQARQERIRTGTKGIDDTFAASFTPDTFAGRRQSYIDYATPQLTEQYDKAQKELVFALDRGGNLDSSVRGDKTAELAKMFDLQQQKIRDDALAQETQLRSDVEGARTDLVRTLVSTGDDAGAVNNAIARANVLSKPASYSPIADAFEKFTFGLGQQAALERAEALSGGAVKGRYNTGLFAPRMPQVSN